MYFQSRQDTDSYGDRLMLCFDVLKNHLGMAFYQVQQKECKKYFKKRIFRGQTSAFVFSELE